MIACFWSSSRTYLNSFIFSNDQSLVGGKWSLGNPSLNFHLWSNWMVDTVQGYFLWSTQTCTNSLSMTPTTTGQMGVPSKGLLLVPHGGRFRFFVISERKTGYFFNSFWILSRVYKSLLPCISLEGYICKMGLIVALASCLKELDPTFCCNFQYGRI